MKMNKKACYRIDEDLSEYNNKFKKSNILKILFIFSLVFVFGVSFVNADTLNNSKIYYSYDSSLTTDDSGNSNTATNFGVTTTTGKLSNGALFATNDYMTTNSAYIDQVSAFSVCGWFSQDIIDSYEMFWRAFNPDRISVFSYTDGNLYFEPKDGANRGYLDYSLYMSAGTFTHICFVYDGSGIGNSNRLMVYFDSTQRVLTFAGTIPSTSGNIATNMYIGSTETGTQYYNGKIDEFVVYDRALNQTEVDFLYNSGAGRNPYNITVFDPIINIDDISLVNNSYYNSNIDIQLNLSISNTNDNLNSSYILYETFNNPLYNGDNISQASTIPLISDGVLTRNQYCIENNYDSASSYTSSSYTQQAIYYNGVLWGLTAINTQKYDSITCQKETQFGTNTLQPNGTILISSLNDSSYSIKFVTENNETQTNSSQYTFTIDSINPSVEYILNTTDFNAYSINMSNLFNVTDTNLDNCTIDITDYENVTSPDTTTINCDDTFAFVHAGLHQLAVNATDLAGNYNDTTIINISVNPLVLVFFNDQFNSTIIKDYTSTIYHPDGRVVNGVIDSNGGTILSPVNNGSLDLGNHTITFSKLGYSTINVTVLINETNAGRNETFNVTRSKIVINIFDRQTNNLLTGLTELTLVATFGANATTTTGNLNISNVNFLAETYQVIAEHEGYDTETVFFTYNNQETLNVNIFMLNSSESGQITTRVITQTGQLISEATCSLLEWKPASSAFVSVGQISTNINGEGVFNVELNTKLYKIQCTKADITVTSIPQSQIFTTNGAIIPIIFDEAADIFDSKLKDVSYTLINTTYNTSHDRITFTWNDDSNLVTEGCIKVYQKQVNTRLLQSSTCASGSSTNIQTLVAINNTYDILVVGEVIDSNGLKEELDQIIYKGINSIQNIFSKWNLQFFIPLISVLGAIAFGLSLRPQTIYISEFVILIVIWGNYILFPSVMLLGTTIFITFIDTLIIWGSYRVRK